MSTLFACEHPAIWRRVHEKYWEVVEAKSNVKGKNSGKLLALEKWYQEELPADICGRSVKYITLSELVKLMEWKLTRGKFRPRLQQLVASNGEEIVEACSRKAFGALPDTRAAITELVSLKGVGPATASAVLAAGAPEQAPFMSDEATESVPGLRPVQYTAKHYALYLDKMVARAAKLREADTQQDWTPCKVEMCLWAWSIADQLQLPFLKEIDVDQSPAKKRTKYND